MWPLQQASRIEEFEPPTGTAQEERVVGGVGIWLNGAQDILVEFWLLVRLFWCCVVFEVEGSFDVA